MNRAGTETDPAKRLRRIWGARIRQQRLANGLTQRSLAARLEDLGLPITPSAIGSWENGETSPRPHHQSFVAQALNVPHSLLFAMSAEDAA